MTGDRLENMKYKGIYFLLSYYRILGKSTVQYAILGTFKMSNNLLYKIVELIGNSFGK